MKIIRFEIFSLLFSLILGTLLHFTFELSGKNILVGTFSAVNESTWEHLKLVFFPVLITTIIGFFVLDNSKSFVVHRLYALLISLSFIVIFFYTYSGILGKNFFVLDILSFIISVVLVEYITLKKFFTFETISSEKFLISIVLWIILLLLFIIFTFCPPEIGLFKDPITNTYGIQLENK